MGVPRLSCKYNTDVFTTISGNKGYRRLAKLTTILVMKQPSTGTIINHLNFSINATSVPPSQLYI